MNLHPKHQLVTVADVKTRIEKILNQRYVPDDLRARLEAQLNDPDALQAAADKDNLTHRGNEVY